MHLYKTVKWIYDTCTLEKCIIRYRENTCFFVEWFDKVFLKGLHYIAIWSKPILYFVSICWSVFSSLTQIFIFCKVSSLLIAAFICKCFFGRHRFKHFLFLDIEDGVDSMEAVCSLDITMQWLGTSNWY